MASATQPPPPASNPVQPAPASQPAAVRPGIDQAWRGELNAWLAARRRYPALAQDRGIEGSVGVTFTVARDGRVDEVSITRSSGSALLDEATRSMLQGQRTLPFPPAMPQDRTTVTVSIRYTLDR